MGLDNLSYPYTIDEGKIDFDFIGFTYNGVHSIRDLNLYRTSDGNRYNDNLSPTATDKTAEVPGGDGTYYFSTFHKQKEFSIKAATDNISEAQYRKMRQIFTQKGIHDLVFDESPYKVWSAKVSGNPSFKFICFDEGGQRVYKGEVEIKFVCYYPYAHTPIAANGTTIDGRHLLNSSCYQAIYEDGVYSSPLFPTLNQWRYAIEIPDQEIVPCYTTTGTNGEKINTYYYHNLGDLPVPISVTFGKTNTALTEGDYTIKITKLGEASPLMNVAVNVPSGTPTYDQLRWNSKTGLIELHQTGGTWAPCPFTGKTYGFIPPDDPAATDFNGFAIEIQRPSSAPSLDESNLQIEFTYLYY